ncbi:MULTISPECIES: V-type ATP synthase subunit I [unclassified Fusibacter]|uniref:V-type ATP synthase subunit I n=1 Tax=unclassified Fusibacter TaxID=2624464 RepID=UPI00101115DA|nr:MULTISPECIES: V-type ATPase 116kDa subunit family protein [unclassified Fusibacter]MCK8059891.1 hypothetical protein [Fusibacter sp. A2]NPE21693.1 hypothetical protein [Fusibacter sp. A1]RXV62096.1 hypothetical protein DWB64_07600 [Fusibacter sp. A1]
MIEKMSFINVVGMVRDVEAVMKTLISTGKVNIVKSETGLKVIRDNYEEIWGVPSEFLTDTMKHLGEPLEIKETEKKLAVLMEKLSMDNALHKEMIVPKLTRAKLIEDVDQIYDKFALLNAKINSLIETYAAVNRQKIIAGLEEVAFNLKKFRNLSHFDIRFGMMDHEYQKRLELNYENVNALVFRLSDHDGEPVFMVITPKVLEHQTNALLRSMYFKPIEILWEYMDYPKVALKMINDKLLSIQDELADLGTELESFEEENGELIKKAYTQLQLEKTLDSVRTHISCTGRHFLTCGWVPTVEVENVKKALNAFMGRIYFVEHSEKLINTEKVPTKLRNHPFFRPFEALVTLYGTPSYREADPTSFLAISYMILFGAMFGDVGQGFIFALVGYLISRKKSTAVSGVLIRIGLSSMLFGFVYDSMFGIEHLISGALIDLFNNDALEHLFLRPIENTNLVLMISVGAGIVFLLVSFVYSIVNKLRTGDIKEGIFGRNGINGLVLFCGLLTLGGMTYYEAPLWSIRIVMAVLGLTVLLLIVREPLSNSLVGKRPLYHEGAGAYYMESGFELLETFLSMLSNGISFIRVGAFALNHVGLFIAFHTIAEMIGTGAGDVAMFLVGNVVVIALEGLIVFIQGLRLIYYEMFSKYYTGDGKAFLGIDVGVTIERQTDYR